MKSAAEHVKNHNIEDDIITLGFTARLLLTNLDRSMIIERAFESMADFSLSDKLGLFIFNNEGLCVCIGGSLDESIEERSFVVETEGTPWERIMETKNHDFFSLNYQEGIPIPVSSEGIDGLMCLCTPLVAADNKVIGIVTFEYETDFELPAIMMQSLLLLLTIIAVALETARLFQQAVYDGLTGLFIRRYFDLRLTEEESRIKRYGGKLAILIVDIDNFKKVNDRYGHQQGDLVLREVADIVKSSVRSGLDSPCRYGGEEFVVIMPDTDLAGALILSERIRHTIQNHVIDVAEDSFRVTLSGGIAFMDQQGFVTGLELLKRADSALYRAKESGRNQIQVWQS
ncbi:MAG: GGDEF domain-containing protein [Syntrophales bacterium]|nr:GGDEF domain-containing protein [Syntrophales bacterium]